MLNQKYKDKINGCEGGETWIGFDKSIYNILHNSYRSEVDDFFQFNLKNNCYIKWKIICMKDWSE